jgi:hypothetical protein
MTMSPSFGLAISPDAPLAGHRWLSDYLMLVSLSCNLADHLCCFLSVIRPLYDR